MATVNGDKKFARERLGTGGEAWGAPALARQLL
jgi:hypothetical protein